MHSCPRCGQACYCHGDIDDCVVETEAYSSAHCTCDCDESRGQVTTTIPQPTGGWGDFEAEGVVARPIVDLQARSGQRIVTKLTAKNFRGGR